MRAGTFCFITGLLTTFGAVGGIENSVTDADLISSVIVAAVGLMIMAVGTQLIRRNQVDSQGR